MVNPLGKITSAKVKPKFETIKKMIFGAEMEKTKF